MNNRKYSSQRAKVTKTSRHQPILLLIGVAILTTIGLGIIGNKIVSKSKKEIQKNYQITECNKKECLYKSEEVLYGLATLKGYYKQYDGSKWEWGNRKVSCDSLMVTGGNQNLIKEFRDLVKAGNTINKIIDNNLLVNIDLLELSSKEKERLDGSNPTSQVELAFAIKTGGGRGVSTCYSFIDIISVKSLDK